MKIKTNIKRKISLMLLVVVFVALDFNLLVLGTRAEDASDIRSDIDKVQEKLEKEQKELEANQANLSVTQKEINITSNVINKTEQEISRKETEIDNLNKRIELNKKILEGYIQEMSLESYDDPAIKFAVSGSFMHEFSGNFDSMLNIKDKVLSIMQEIKEDKEELSGVKQELAEKKEEHEDLLAEKQVEKKEIASEIVEVQASIGELQKKLAELQSDLMEVSGKSYSAGDIREAVEYASGKTGVPKGVLYGFLKMETNLGANTGQCTYKKVVDVALARYKTLLKKNKKWQGSIDLLYNRRDIFYDLVDDLGYNKDKKVSCTPSGYIGQGGAMGVSQFMSDVWNGYSSQISAKTGNSKPDPWDLTDGVMAMAIKLRKAGATSDKASVIKSASINYLGGFNSGYYNGIVYWSKNYKTLFN